MAACIAASTTPIAVLKGRAFVKATHVAGRSFLRGDLDFHPLNCVVLPTARRVCEVRSALAVDSESAELASYFKPSGWTKMGLVGQSAAIGVTTLAGSVVMNHDVPAPVRLALLSYFLATSAEWAFHKYDMHETDACHIFHHSETNPNMTMPEGYDETAIQFPRSASIKIAGLGVLVLAAFDFALRLDIPYWEVVPASLAVASSHALMWNTLHPDTHYLIVEDGEKFSDSNGAAFIADFPLRGTALWNWLILNHTGHHTIIGNYNCVFPGADCIYGTFYTHNEKMEGRTVA
jgi:hypothetical protein